MVHSPEERRRAKKLVEELREDGLDVAFDEWEVPAGGTIVQQIYDRAIGKLDAILLFLPVRNETPKWIKELDDHTVRRLMGQIRLVTVRTSGCPIPLSLIKPANSLWVSDRECDVGLREDIYTLIVSGGREWPA
jgi:hypothetical protein